MTLCTYPGQVVCKPGWPDRANLRSMGDCVIWAVTWKLQKYSTFFGYFIPWLIFCTNCGKKWVGLHFGWFFTNSSGHPVWSSSFCLVFKEYGSTVKEGHQSLTDLQDWFFCKSNLGADWGSRHPSDRLDGEKMQMSRIGVESRVTRLGELSPFGPLLTLGSFIKFTLIAQMFWLHFSMVKVEH
jgi:hypothetical protein